MSELLKIAFIDDSFSIDKSEEYQLLIGEGLIDYQMAIFTRENQLLLLLSWPKNSHEERVIQLLRLTYHTKKIALNNSNIILVPKELYHPDQDIHYLNLFGLRKEEYVLLTDRPANLSSHSIYPLAQDELLKLDQDFPGFSCYAKNTSLLSILQQLQPAPSYLALNFDGSYVDFSYFLEGKLQYHQTQLCQHADEFNYFLLATAQAFEIDLSELRILLSGSIADKDVYYERLKKYSNHLYFTDLSTLFTCSDNTFLQQASEHLTLFGLLCAS